jgi:hypothetical protein
MKVDLKCILERNDQRSKTEPVAAADAGRPPSVSLGATGPAQHRSAFDKKPVSERLKYEEVEKYLRTFSTLEPPYDFNGLLQLVAAGVENLRQNGVDRDLDDYAWTLSDEQVLFLRKLIDARPQSIAHQEADR